MYLPKLFRKYMISHKYVDHTRIYNIYFNTKIFVIRGGTQYICDGSVFGRELQWICVPSPMCLRKCVSCSHNVSQLKFSVSRIIFFLKTREKAAWLRVWSIWEKPNVVYIMTSFPLWCCAKMEDKSSVKKVRLGVIFSR
jgi:hypothetical protein